jgi:ABC-type uncharacterized transport system fused permease/ATPase subunit
LIGYKTPAILLTYFLTINWLLGYLREPTAMFIYYEQKLEGALRGIISRIVMNAEQIASLRGDQKELNNILKGLGNIVQHIRSKYQYKAVVNVLDGVFSRYFSQLLGYSLLGLSFLPQTSFLGNKTSDPMENTTVSRYNLLTFE